MRRAILFLLGVAVFAPAISFPAQAQSVRDIQRLEEQVQRAKQHGDWRAVSVLEPQLNQARLQYQRRNGMGEVNDNGYRNGGFYPANNGAYYPANNGAYYPANNGAYYPNTGAYYPANNGACYPTNGGYHPTNNGAYYPVNNGAYYPAVNRPAQRGYYDRQGRWRTY